MSWITDLLDSLTTCRDKIWTRQSYKLPESPTGMAQRCFSNLSMKAEKLNSGRRRGRSRLPHNDKSTPNAKRVKVRPPAVTLSTQQQIEALKKIDLDELKMANPISIVAPGAGPEPAIKSRKAALAHARTALEHIIHGNRNNDAENEDINENDLDSGKIKDKQLEHVVLSKWMIKSDRHFLWRDEIEPDAI